jgi:curved DNA-binding protein CbpA
MTAVPSAQGSLQQTPLLHLLVYALDRHLNGTLVLEDPNRRKHAILFTGGVPSKARPAEAARRLGELLIERKACPETAIAAALEQGKAERRLLGQILLDHGAIDAEQLAAALGEQLCRNVLLLAGLPGETAFGYYEGTNYLERWAGAGTPVAALALIWRVARAHADAQQVAHFLGRLGEGPLRLQVDAPLSLLALDSHTQAVVDVLRAKPQPLAELVSRELCDADTLRRLIYTLVLLRHLELPGSSVPIGAQQTTSQRPPSVPPRAPTPRTRITGPRVTPAKASASLPEGERLQMKPSVPSAPETVALRAEIKRRAEDTGASYYEVLGVPTEAAVDVIQNAFFQLAKVWHPDRLPSELADVRDLATRAFARMSEAHQTLIDAERRREYDAKSAAGGTDAAEQEQVQRVLRAHTAYQKAVVHMKRNALEAAEVEARRAAEDDPEQADYIGLVAWLESLKPGAKLEPLIAELDKAVKMEENNLRVRWFRGQLFKRLGRNGRALADFRFIFERDPKHVDAQREIRLFEMRKGAPSKSDPPPAGDAKPGGVFGRFFKKP